MTETSLTRLHITPLNPDLLPIVLGSNLTKTAQNISYQAIDTFPENSYGFLDLPSSDAKKLITKLNGAILKGKKMKIEEARAKKRSHAQANPDEQLEIEASPKKSRKAKKEREKDVIDGHELPEGRKVKRGWTEPKVDKSKSKKPKEKKNSKHQAPSKYVEKEELLFRTSLPPNREHLDTTKKHRKGKQDSTDTIVHEFEKTFIQPSFLRDTSVPSSRAAEYVETVGWVDEKGNVVENEPPSVRRSKSYKAQGLMIDVPASRRAAKPSAQLVSPLPATASSKDQSTPPMLANQITSSAKLQNDDTSSSGSSSSSEGTAATHSEGEGQSDDGRNVTAPGTPPKLHPLEALFKKPQPPAGTESAKPSLEVETSFSFSLQADAEEEDNDNDEVPPMPATPFTSHDLHSRGVRSAAPTPDTAHPSRFTSFASALAARPASLPDEDDADEAAADGRSMPSTEHSDKRNESDFEKRFWAERGANNRAFKATQRMALKEERQKQNRLRRPRNW